MLQLTEELLLIHNGVDTAFGDDASFGHLLHSVKFLLLAQLDFPDFAEAATTDHIEEVEVVLVDL